MPHFSNLSRKIFRIYQDIHNMFCFPGTRAEVELGRILSRRGWKRTSYIVTTKIYWSTRQVCFIIYENICLHDVTKDNVEWEQLQDMGFQKLFPPYNVERQDCRENLYTYMYVIIRDTGVTTRGGCSRSPSSASESFISVMDIFVSSCL